MGRAPRDCTEVKACSIVLNGYPLKYGKSYEIKRRVHMQQPRCEGRGVARNLALLRQD